MTAKLNDLRGLPDWPALLSREQAAIYCGMSMTSFDMCVKRQVFPPPLKLPIRRKLWSRAAIDSIFTSQSSKDDFERRERAWREAREARERYLRGES